MQPHNSEDHKHPFGACLYCDKCDKARDLLRRIRLSSEDGTLDIPDVRHGFEAEITELLGN